MRLRRRPEASATRRVLAVRAWSGVVRSSDDDDDHADRPAPVGHGHLLRGATRKRARPSNHPAAPYGHPAAPTATPTRTIQAVPSTLQTRPTIVDDTATVCHGRHRGRVPRCRRRPGACRLRAEHGIGGPPHLLEHLAQLIADHPSGPTARPANAIRPYEPRPVPAPAARHAFCITDEGLCRVLRSTRDRLRSHGCWPPRRMRMATPGQARLCLVRASPCPRLMRGPSRHHELLAASTRFSIVSSVGPAGRQQHRRPARRWQAVGADRGTRRGPGLWQGRGGGLPSASLTLPAGVGSGTTPPGGPHLPDVHLQPGDPGGLAAGRGRHPGGDGGHRPAAGSPAGRCCRSAGWSCCWPGARHDQDPARPQDRRR
jgi:hypothetical protein